MTKIFYPSALLLIVISLLSAPSFAQQPVCGTDEYYADQLEKHPEMLPSVKEALDDYVNYMNHPPRMKKAGLKTIPVVFHVIHTNGYENISDDNIHDNMEQINMDFRKLNADTSNVRKIFRNLMVDMQYEFTLAKVDDKGNCTDGINRVYSELTDSGNDNVKRLVQWDPNRYLNVWVVKTINRGGQTGIAGYANFPWWSRLNDGIVIRSDQVRRGDRTLTHEIGHYMGLYHTFQGGCRNSNCNQDNDGVCDTPPSQSRSSIIGCNNQDGCTSDTLPDMLENFMEYTNCEFMFTKGQKVRADYYMANYRATLTSTNNLYKTGVLTSTTLPPIADFSSDITRVCAGGSVGFNNLTCQATFNKVKWYFPGSREQVSTEISPSVTYDSPGIYKVKLTVSNNTGADSVVKEAYIEVIEPQYLSPFVEGFEDTAFFRKSFEFHNGNMSIGWESTDKAASSGDFSVFLNNFNLPKNQEMSFTLPLIDVSWVKEVKLNFDYAFARKTSSDIDILRVYLSRDCGKSWILQESMYSFKMETSNGPVTSEYFPTSQQWASKTVDFRSVTQGEKILVKFNFLSGGGNNIFIDNINITGNTSVKDISAAGKFRVFPNPVENNLQIVVPTEMNNVNISIKNALGREMYFSNRENQGNIELNLQELPGIQPGIYFISLSSGDEVYTQKIIYLNR